MGTTAEQPWMLSADLPGAVVYALAAAAVVLWVCSHFLLPRGRGRVTRAVVFLLRVLAGTVCVWLLFNAACRVLVLSTAWPLILAALLGAAATEVVCGLYELERQTVSRRAGLVLVALRMTLVLLVVLMLVEPVFSRNATRAFQRYLAVLLDDSASMHLIDRQASVSEKLHLFELFRPDAAQRPFKLDEAAPPLETAREKLAAQDDWLALLKDAAFDMVARQLEGRRQSMKKLLEQARATVEAQHLAIQAAAQSPLPFDRDTRKGLKDVAEQLTKHVRDPLAAATTLVGAEGAEQLGRNYGQLTLLIRRAHETLADVVARLPALALKVDEAYFASLPPEQRRDIDSTVLQPRLAVAHTVLLSAHGETPSLVNGLDKEYIVRFYKFAAQPAEVDLAQWREDVEVEEQLIGEAALQLDSAQATDLSAALERVMADVPVHRLAGVLVLSDGRHNTKANIEGAARRLGMQQAPVCSVTIGSTQPPPDAVVTGIIAPHTVYVEDRLVIEAGLKFDGLRGKDAHVTLKTEGRIIDEQVIRVPSDHFRTIVDLTDRPKEKGLHEYEVEIDKFAGETFEANNGRVVNVAVSDERTKLLILEGHPRWEFRYVRNLFAGRDKSVLLRHVLFHPDWIEGVKERPKVHASTAEKDARTEATLLPETEAEWLKFDVVLLGDVSPEDLGDEALKVLEKFVSERGGTLIVIAGPRHMPHAYAESPLRHLLPVTFEPSDEMMTEGPEPSFHITLTDAGRGHIATRQSDVPEESLRIWRSLPDVYWRHPITGTKPGASVLAYAMPAKPPEIFDPDKTGVGQAAERVLRLRKAFERENALIAVHKFGLGKVMMLTFDRTWRMRYRIGDTHHHKLWGQILRWATGGKLQAGTDLVRLGTDRMLYYPDEPICVRAKVVKPDRSPLVSNDVAVNVYEDTRLVLRKTLAYLPDSGGMYEADLGALPPDATYRIELESARVRSLLEGMDVGAIETEVTVAPVHSAELIELSADRANLDKMAALSRGAVAEPAKARRVLERYGPGTEEVTEERKYLLWNSWPLLLIMVVIVTVEWVLRKKVGLT